MDRDQIMAKLRQSMPSLHARYGVVGLWLFGSFARNQATPTSDVDLLAEFDRPISLFGIASLGGELEELLGVPVDVGAREDLRSSVRDDVLREALRVA